MNERAKIAAMVGLPVVALGAVAWVALGGSEGDGDGDGEAKARTTTVLEDAHSACLAALSGSEWRAADLQPDMALSLIDGGRSVLVETPPAKNGETAAFDAAKCLVEESGGPQSLTAKFDQTSALMGRQTDTYGDIEVSWTYVADGNGGFSAIFEMVD